MVVFGFYFYSFDMFLCFFFKGTVPFHQNDQTMSAEAVSDFYQDLIFLGDDEEVHDGYEEPPPSYDFSQFDT
jgi:hypothetical protein